VAVSLDGQGVASVLGLNGTEMDYGRRPCHGRTMPLGVWGAFQVRARGPMEASPNDREPCSRGCMVRSITKLGDMVCLEGAVLAIFDEVGL
jgi:hypothetical protein